MAKRASNNWECLHCGRVSSKWLGRCDSCLAFDSFIEVKGALKPLKEPAHAAVRSHGKGGDLMASPIPTPITEVKEEHFARFPSHESEFDLVIGGGIVEGGLYLIGGSPGVGKSTLLLKVALNIASNTLDNRGEPAQVLYVSGEESASQISSRARRIGQLSPSLYLLSEINFSAIIDAVLERDYKAIIIDSIQTIYNEELSSAVGSVSQIKEITFALMRLAKEKNIAIFIIGHITKDGAIAGPRVLEHMVDCVLYFEGEKSSQLRLLRGFKNRFGSTNEIGIFEMGKDGLVSAKLASRLFFENKSEAIGQSYGVVLEGSRALVIEVQALVATSNYPRRQATGYDLNRLNMLLALLEKKLEIPLSGYDVYLNIAGGIRLTTPCADLCIIACILSSFKNRVMKKDSAFLGEVSLIGDIRSLPAMEVRLRELEALGFKHAILPHSKEAKEMAKKAAKKTDGSTGKLKLHFIKNVEELIGLM